MIFASPIFLFWFLPAVLLVYFATPWKFKPALVLLVSLVFYGWWRADFLVLMLFTAVFDWCVGGRVAKLTDVGARKRLVAFSCTVNLGLLAYFKYANFGIETLNALLSTMGVGPLPFAHVILPVGISFFTFQSMSYTIDVYRGEVKPVDSLLHFASFVAMFPQLVAGPIVRYRDVADQLRFRTHTWAKFATGALLFQMGFAKKVLLADGLAPMVKQAFDLARPTFAEAWLGTVAYTFQIYFDFSGYSDMAIGLGLFFGFMFPINFDQPYRSRGVTEFWRRWHITLSNWLRDYLYIPLGGNRKGPAKTYLFLLITMLLGGLWHGAAWTFILWGAYQGVWLVIERFHGRRPLWDRAPALAQIAITFVVTMGGWVFFRAPTADRAGAFFQALAGLNGGYADLARVDFARLQITVLVAAALVTFGLQPSHRVAARASVVASTAAAVAFAAAIAHLFFQSYSPFLYFQF